MPSTHSFLLGAAAAAAFVPAAIAATTSTINPVADAFVTSGNATGNFGGGGAFSVSAPLANGELQGVLRFDTAATIAGFNSTFGAGQWAITSVTLKLTAATPNAGVFNSPSAAGQFAASWMVNDSWVEGTGSPASPGATGITWSTLPGFLSGGDEGLGTLSFGGGTSGATTWSLALAPGFVADASAGGLVSFRFAAVDSTMAGVFNSRSHPTTANRPELAITAEMIPAPGAMAILASGGLTLLRRRREVPNA